MFSSRTIAVLVAQANIDVEIGYNHELGWFWIFRGRSFKELINEVDKKDIYFPTALDALLDFLGYVINTADSTVQRLMLIQSIADMENSNLTTTKIKVSDTENN